MCFHIKFVIQRINNEIKIGNGFNKTMGMHIIYKTLCVGEKKFYYHY